jgi:hypothetical protein
MMHVPGQSLHWRPAQLASDKVTIRMQAMAAIFLNR